MLVAPIVAPIPFLLIGIHLVRVALRSRALPDRLLAGFFLLLAAGIPPRLISLQLTTTDGVSTESLAWQTAGSWLLGSALVLLVAFTWKVFRAERSWARWLTFSYGLVFLGVLVISTMSIEATERAQPLAVAFGTTGILSIGWAFVECALYYRRMRRRCQLGLASPVVANRFLLWCLWTGALTFQGAMQVGLRFALWITGAGAIIGAGGDPGGLWLGWIAAARAILAILGPLVAVSVWLSFSPPAAYERWIEGGESAPA